MFFFFNDTATTEIYTLSLHDALPIYRSGEGRVGPGEGRLGVRDRRARRQDRRGHPLRATPTGADRVRGHGPCRDRDRKSTRLNSSHANISYAVFCLKKKKHTTLLYTH